MPDIENLLKQVEFTLAFLFNKALSLFAVSDAEFILWWLVTPVVLIYEEMIEGLTTMAGKYYEELEVGSVIKHSIGRTITEMDNVLFCSLTMNSQPLHINADFASRSQFGQRIVNGIFTLGLATGITVPELTEGTLVANLGYENVKHPHPMFHGDTLYVETEVVSKRVSKSKPDQGIVQFKHTGRNQDGVVVLEFTRSALMLKKLENVQ